MNFKQEGNTQQRRARHTPTELLKVLLHILQPFTKVLHFFTSVLHMNGDSLYICAFPIFFSMYTSIRHFPRRRDPQPCPGSPFSIQSHADTFDCVLSHPWGQAGSCFRAALTFPGLKEKDKCLDPKSPRLFFPLHQKYWNNLIYSCSSNGNYTLHYFKKKQFAVVKDSPWIFCCLLKCVLSNPTLAQINRVTHRNFTAVICLPWEKAHLRSFQLQSRKRRI